MRDGSWGLRGTDGMTEGSSVIVARKNGTTSTEIIGRRVWGDGSVAIYSIDQRAQAHSEHGALVCVECGYSGRGVHYVRDMSGIQAPVCRRCDDGGYNSFA
jgi:hypothetical protein